MLVPLLFGVAAVSAVVNRLRTRASVEREFAERFPSHDGVVAGAESFAHAGTNGCGVLLIHGSGDTPQTLRYLGEQLHAAGFSVSAPLLPGHGRTPRAFAMATASDYIDEARAALRALRSANDRVALVGLSMGGAVAARIAAEERDVRSLVLLAPYLVPPATVRRIAATGGAWGLVSPYLKGRGEASVFDAEASRASLAYGTFSPGALRALVETAANGLRAVGNLALPTLVVNSERDNRVPRACAEQALRAFRVAPETRWVSGCGHVITIDYCKETVAQLTLEFLERTTG